MKIKKSLALMACAFGFGMSVSVAAPHWVHEYEPNAEYNSQPDWGSIEDASQDTIPAKYPYAECGIGTHQSPIDLSNEINSASLNGLSINYPKDYPDYYNTGHAPQVNVSTNYSGKLKVGNDVFPLVQYHLHAPSEHIIGATKFAAELHFVHVKADGKIAVLGVLLKVGRSNSTLGTILAYQLPLDNLGEAQHNSGPEIDPMKLLPEDKTHFYSYAGSLTTPPCSEGVSWYVLSHPVEISQAQLDTLKSINLANEGFDYNNRVTQGLNGRVVSGKK